MHGSVDNVKNQMCRSESLVSLFHLGLVCAYMVWNRHRLKFQAVFNKGLWAFVKNVVHVFLNVKVLNA